MLNRTKKHNIGRTTSFVLNVMVFMLIAYIGKWIGSLIIGAVVAFLITTIIHLYQKGTNPGKLKHYRDYANLPPVLSGNKRERK